MEEMMWQQPQQIYGRVLAVLFHNPDNGYMVIRMDSDEHEELTVVGALASAAPGESLVVVGQYIEHRQYGLQFEAQACEYYLPSEQDDILLYLSSAQLPGIGPATARKLVQKFGRETLEILASEPERLAEVKGFSVARAREAQRRFLEIFSLREAVALLGGFGLDAAEALALYRAFGKASSDKVRQNPYSLCAWPLHINFARADAIAAELQLEQNSDQRAQAAILYTLRRNLNNGHTCLPQDKLLATVTQVFGLPPELVEQQLRQAEEDSHVCTLAVESRVFVYLEQMYYAECQAALAVRTMLAMPSALQADDVQAAINKQQQAAGIEYAPLQKKAIEQALCHSTMVITGGPGTGKTTTVNAIIAMYEQQHERVLLAAPTGRAAKRMAELTGRTASTIHRLLEVDFSQGEEFPRFKRNAKNPLRCDVLVVDEMSMVDAMLFCSLLEALRPGCKLVMVGDANQLPSVGAGSVLKGIIESACVPVIELKEIFRQASSSLIVENAHRIVQGEPPKAGGKQDDYFFLSAVGSACRQLVCQLVTQRLPQAYGLSSVEDIQVLCPGHGGPVGVFELNSRLQQQLNPPQADKPEIKNGERVFRLGDKVMQVRNNYDIPYTRADGELGAGAFNGDIGIIHSINPAAGSLVVECDDRLVEYGAEDIFELELAYATTIHKSQGSEFEAVVIALSEVPKPLQYRNLLYTAITRAKKVCVIAGEDAVLQEMVRRDGKNKRYSCFWHMLKRGEEM